MLAWAPWLVLAAALALVVRSRLGSSSRSRSSKRTAFLRRTLGLSGQDAQRTRIVAFFHPYCNAGGGGERVLWTALACMQRQLRDQRTAFVVYTGDVGSPGEEGRGTVSKDAILAKVQARFGISLSPSTLAFVPLRHRWLIEDSTYPRLTLIGQSLGSVALALEGLVGSEGVAPDVWIDTMGYAFAYPLVKGLLGIPVGSYTHYPTISTDMLSRVRSRTAGHTNPSSVASSAVLSRAKLVYYTLFARAYAWCLAKADTVMVNSTWTKRHVVQLLGDEGEEEDEEEDEGAGDTLAADGVAAPRQNSELRRRRTAPEAAAASPPQTASSPPQPRPRPRPRPHVQTVYPPCDTAAMTAFPCTTSSRVPSPTAPILILSLAQFRPEKEHATQLRALALLLRPGTRADEDGKKEDGAEVPLPRGLDPERLRLVLAGSARHAADHARVAALRAVARELGVEDQVEFVVNAAYADVCRLMRRASVGLHTMVDEHFGITVVEFQAAGLLTLAHASAGPLLDILVPCPASSSSSTHSPGPTGFLAHTSSSSPASTPAHAFATQLAHMLSLPEAEQDAVRARARESAVARFGVEAFERGWMRAWGELEARMALPLLVEPRRKRED